MLLRLGIYFLIGVCLGYLAYYIRADWVKSHALLILFAATLLRIAWAIYALNFRGTGIGEQKLSFPVFGVVWTFPLFSVVYLIVIAGLIARYSNGQLSHQLGLMAVILLASALCVDDIYGVVLYISAMALLFLSGTPAFSAESVPSDQQPASARRFFVLQSIGFFAGLAILLALKGKSYLTMKFGAFLHPSESALRGGYAYIRALVIRSHAYFLGGTDMSASVNGSAPVYLPDFTRVSVLTYVLARWGWAAVLLLCLLIAAFCWQITKACISLPRGAQRVLGSAIALYLTVQFLLNVSMFAGLCPITDLALPFISYSPVLTCMNTTLFVWLLTLVQDSDAHALQPTPNGQTGL